VIAVIREALALTENVVSGERVVARDLVASTELKEFLA